MSDIRFLEEHGIVPVRQPIRGSQWNTACSDPFRFYLTTRLCLTRAFNESKALTAGSWTHFAAEHHNDNDAYSHQLNQVRASMREVGLSLRMSNDTIATQLERETFYAETAWVWWHIVSKIPLPNGVTIDSMYHKDSNFRIVAREVKIRVPPEHLGTDSEIVIQPDAIAYNEKTDTLWIIDWKSTAWTTDERLSVCPLEFACQLYSHVFAKIMKDKTLPHYVPKLAKHVNAKFGGMIHIAYQKPTIKFGREDRPYRWVSDGKRKGIWATIEVVGDKAFRVKHMGAARKWEFTTEYTTLPPALEAMHKLTGKKPEKEYDDEPTLAIYHNRCSDWYHGRNEYGHLEAERNTCPVVNMSTVTYDELCKPLWLNEFKNRIAVIDDLAMRHPDPALFPKHGNPTSYNTVPSKDPYYPFYVLPVTDWPAVIVDKQLIQLPRD